MKTKRFFILTIVSLLIVTMIIGCGKTEPEVPQSKEPVNEVQDSGPKRGGTLIIGKGQKWSTLNPTKANAQDSDYDFYAQIFEPLVGMDASGNLTPALAESWDIKDDTTIVFKLREDVKFHDGTDFNAEAVKYVMDWYKSEECSPFFASQIAELESVEVIDQYTVQFNLSKPSATFLVTLSNYASLMMSPTSIEKYGEDLHLNAVGTGPFKVKEAIEGDHITLVRNENYYRMGEDGLPLPYLDEVVIKIIPDDTVKATNIQSGDIHLTDWLTTTSIEMLQKNPNKTIARLPSADVYCLFPNVNFGPLKNEKVRQAIAYAINREEMAAIVTRGLGSPAIWAAGENQWFYSDETPYTHDIEKAKALMVEAGYPDGFSIKLQCISREPDNTIMAIVQQQPKAIDINVELESMERLAWIDLYTKQLAGELGLAKMTYPRVDAYVQLNTNLGATSANNYSQYKGERFNELLEKIRTEYDIEKRKSLLQEAQSVYLEDSATIFLIESPRYVCYDNSVMNFETFALGNWKLSSIWLNK